MAAGSWHAAARPRLPASAGSGLGGGARGRGGARVCVSVGVSVSSQQSPARRVVPPPQRLEAQVVEPVKSIVMGDMLQVHTPRGAESTLSRIGYLQN
jgi:hypothetical protein